MGTSKFIEPDSNQIDDLFETGFEDSAFLSIEEKVARGKLSSAKARKTIEQLREEKMLREMLYDDFDDTMEA